MCMPRDRWYLRLIMTTSLTKADLRTIYASLARLLPPAPSLPKTPEEVVEIGRVKDVVATLIVEYRSEIVFRGTKVLEWRVPTALAPTMNNLAFMKKWQHKLLNEKLDDLVRTLLDEFPAAKLHGAQKMRWARVTRFTPSRGKIDELSIDAIGGKKLIDALVRHGVFYDDAPKYLHREPGIAPTHRGNTHVLVEVFEVTEEGTHTDDAPKDAPVAQVVRRKGPLTKAIIDGGAGTKVRARSKRTHTKRDRRAGGRAA